MPFSNVRTVDVICVVAATAWAVAILVFMAGAMLSTIGHPDLGAATMVASVFLLCIAGLTSIHAMMKRHMRDIANAFELGRDTGRMEAGVPLQRVH